MLASLVFASLAAGVAASPAPSEEPVDLHRSRDNIIIDVYVHVVMPPAPGYPLNLSAQTIEKQVNFLNKHFKKPGFFFNLLDTDWTHTLDWPWRNDTPMAMATRMGDNSTLNLWYKPQLEDHLDGRGTYPTLLNASWRSQGIDGCIIRADKVFGFADGVLGTTMAREVGHWLGLFDTAQPGWSGLDEGTGVPGVGEVPKCRGGPGEPCLADFTELQVDRMRFFWGLRVQSRTASELQPLTPYEAAGKLPFYPEPRDRRLFYLKCKYEVYGSRGVEWREDYCGSKHFCRTRGWEQTDRTRYSDEKDCLSARADPPAA